VSNGKQHLKSCPDRKREESSGFAQTKLEHSFNRFDAKEYERLVVDFFVQSGASFNIIEGAAFKRLEVRAGRA
jgi:hypothetical protein